MIAQVIQILTNQGQSLTEQIKANVPRVTGKTADSLGYEVVSDKDSATLTITAKPFFRVVETGRRPTPEKKPSRDMIKNITEWLKALGKEQSLAWAIATKINKEGTKLWRDGGREDVFSNVLTDRAFNKLERSVYDALADHYLETVITDLKRLQLIK